MVAVAGISCRWTSRCYPEPVGARALRGPGGVAASSALCSILLVCCGPEGPTQPERIDQGFVSDGVAEVRDLAPPEHRSGVPLLYWPEEEGGHSGIDHVTDLAFSCDDSSMDDFTGGFAALDCDLDGDADLVFTSGSGGNQLFINDGEARFVVAEGAGVDFPGQHFAGASVADYDRDGDPDLLLLVQHGDNRLLANDGACTFEDRTDEVGLHDEHRSLFANWADLNQDGWLDLYLANWGEASSVGPPTAAPEPDRLWLSDGAGGFVDMSAELPAVTGLAYGMMIGFLDYDGDADLDFFLWNDKANLAEGAHLFRNDGISVDGLNLVDVSLESGFDLREDGMDLAVADFDRDGDADLAVTGAVETILVNHGGSFVDSGASLGMTSEWLGPFSWAMPEFDPDGDGDQDLLITQSWFFDLGPDFHDSYVAEILFYRNDLDETGSFARPVLPGALGEDHAWRGALAIDLNGDGFEDLVTSSGNEPARIFLSNPPSGHGVVQVRLHGSASNREGRGAVVRLDLDGIPLMRWPGAAPPYSSGMPTWLTFGLGDAEVAGPLEILWPSGITQRIESVEAGTRVDVFEPE